VEIPQKAVREFQESCGSDNYIIIIKHYTVAVM